MLYYLHSISQVGADVWWEMYNGVHGNGKSTSHWNAEYFSITPSEYDSRFWQTTYLLKQPEDTTPGYESGRILPWAGEYVHKDDFD